jgi:hypothetical protein
MNEQPVFLELWPEGDELVRALLRVRVVLANEFDLLPHLLAAPVHRHSAKSAAGGPTYAAKIRICRRDGRCEGARSCNARRVAPVCKRLDLGSVGVSVTVLVKRCLPPAPCVVAIEVGS